jgi:hypothetical protein
MEKETGRRCVLRKMRRMKLMTSWKRSVLRHVFSLKGLN